MKKMETTNAQICKLVLEDSSAFLIVLRQDTCSIYNANIYKQEASNITWMEYFYNTLITK